MPPPNARTLRFKNIVENINRTTCNMKTSNLVLSNKENLEKNSPNPESSCVKAIYEIPQKTNDEKPLSHYLRRRSLSGEDSEEDFSPVSDDDKEFIPDSNTSSESYIDRSSSSSNGSSSSSSSDAETSSSSDSQRNYDPGSSQEHNIVLSEPTPKKRPRYPSLESKTVSHGYEEKPKEHPDIFSADMDASSISSQTVENYLVSELPDKTSQKINSDNVEDHLSGCESDEIVTVIVIAEDILLEAEKQDADSTQQLMENICENSEFQKNDNSQVNTYNETDNLTVPENNQINAPNEQSPKKTRKRLRHGNKKSTAKVLRNLGLQYKSVFGKCSVVSERSMGNPCGDHCRLKCTEKLNAESRKSIFDGYWRMGLLSRQRDFIASHIVEIKPKYQYKRVDSNRKNKQAFYLPSNGDKIRVCKTFFKNTLGINDRPIRTVIDKKNTKRVCRTRPKRSATEKKLIEEEYQNHIIEKDLSRKEKQQDKELASYTVIVACYDLQAVMPVPKGEVSVFYYNSKLSIK
ncbi:hypothetical protein ACJJTC_004528 [Scirpophaga incertulas]